MTTDETRDEDTATAASVRERGLTDADQERIREYLEKPPHLRSSHDLLPDSDASAD